VLSTLLGYHPPELPVRTLVRVGALFDIAERTVRVALVRMVADGEVTSDGGVYRLAGRLVARQHEQQDSCSPQVRNAHGEWQLAVVTASGRSLAARTMLRREMRHHRMAELREGVWLRPANLVRGLPPEVARDCVVFPTRPDDPTALAAMLWDLDVWSRRARQLLAELASELDLHDGFLVSAAVLRHLQDDPVLPAELLPDDWPGPRLRAVFASFEAGYAARLRAYGIGPVVEGAVS
jgi:phenylacetic acid degradation operon negative regulatory protein